MNTVAHVNRRVPRPRTTCAGAPEKLRRTLESLHGNAKLARSLLVAATPTADALYAFLTTAITDFVGADDQPISQAGRIMHAYFSRRRRDHIGVAIQLHLSRATYFRRLDHGLNALTQRLLTAFRPQ